MQRRRTILRIQLIERGDRSTGGHELRHQFCAAVHTEAAIQRFHVYMNRVLTQAQRLRDLLFPITGEQQAQSLPHPW